MDDVNASAIQLNNTLSQNNHGNGSPHHPDSQTASEFIDTQLQLEADAREALPYAFDHCTQSLGPLRQNLYSCLTCSPPPSSPSDPYVPAAVCYSCSIACHGEHTLVELFNRRNFTCDCGTIRLPSTSPCTLRIDPATGLKGPVHSQAAAEGNTYNQNFQNRFCGCGDLYDAHAEKGTMFQCLGLATEQDGGCGEDWWHPECVNGLGRGWAKKAEAEAKQENAVTSAGEEEDDADVLPPGFPQEDDFETFICYKCVEAQPWIRRYAGSAGFLPAVYKQVDQKESTQERALSELLEKDTSSNARQDQEDSEKLDSSEAPHAQSLAEPPAASKKRKVEDDFEDSSEGIAEQKRAKTDANDRCHYDTLSEPLPGKLSLFLKEDFRDHMCRCPKYYPTLSKHPQLLEEEESYQPPLSEAGDEDNRSGGTGSLLDRGEAALSNVDRVRAIEGVMVYNHLKDKVKDFLQPFAESGQAVGAEDIKAYFEKLRGDEQGMKSAQTLLSGSNDNGGDNRREQSGY